MSDLFDIEPSVRFLRESGLDRWSDIVGKQLEQKLFDRPHGSIDAWLAAIDALPVSGFDSFSLDQDVIRFGNASDVDSVIRKRITDALMRLHPWRKGPFELFGVVVDSEWRSNLKWARLAPHIGSLEGRTVLDVGCGNGYYAMRMLGAGADRVIGLDPTLLFHMQNLGLRRLAAGHSSLTRRFERFHFLPLGIEAMPSGLKAFDHVFSMGVLYHRRSPLDHLIELRDALKPGGLLVLETLVVQGEEGYSLVPKDRYARMRNVWFIPSCATLEAWLLRIGMGEVRTVDVSATTLEEQRATAWMRFESLSECLDPHDPTRTVEGYPAPTRAIVIARK